MSQDMIGQTIVGTVAGISYAGLIIESNTSDPSGPSSSVVKVIRAALPQLRKVTLGVFTPLVSSGWQLRHDPGSRQLAIRDASGNGFVCQLHVDPTAGWWQAVRKHGQLLLLMSEYAVQGGDDLALDRQLDNAVRKGLLYGGIIVLADIGYVKSEKHIQEHPRQEEDPSLKVLINPVGFLMELTNLVQSNVLPMEEAWIRLRSIYEPRAQKLFTTKPFDEMITSDLINSGLLANGHTRSGIAYTYARLVVALADGLGNTTNASFWFEAAGLAVATATQALSCTHDVTIYFDAEPISQRRIEALRATGERDALAGALVDAARLRLALCGHGDLGGDWYAADALSCARASEIWDRYVAVSQSNDERVRPDILSCVSEADEFLTEVLEFCTGHLRARALIAYSQIEIINAAQAQRPVNIAYLLGVLNEAVHAIDAAADPAAAVYLVRFLYLTNPGEAFRIAFDIFSIPFDGFLNSHGETVTHNTISQGIEAARALHAPELLRQVLSWSDRMPEAGCEPHARQVCEAWLHCLPNDPISCPAPDANIAALARKQRSEARVRGWTLAQRGAAWTHLAAHARTAGQLGLGLELLYEVDDTLADKLNRGYSLLLGDLHYEAVIAGVTTLLFPTSAFREGLAAAGYSLANLFGLAQACLVRHLVEIDQSSGRELGIAIGSAIAAAPRAHASRDVRLGMVVHDLIHTAVIRSLADDTSFSTHLALHQAAKGADFTTRQIETDAFIMPEDIIDDLARLSAVEAADIPDEDGLFAEVSLGSGAETDLIPFVDGYETEAGGTDSQIAKNLRQHIDRKISRALAGARYSEPGQEMSAYDVQLMLDERTVLLTWFFPRREADHVLLTITREDFSAVIVHSDREEEVHPDARRRVIGRHSLTDEVAATRAAIITDPLFRNVSREGEHLLSRVRYLIGDESQLTEWRKRGKDRLCVWPHGPLHYLPFHLYSVNGQPIANDWTLSVIPSLKSLNKPSHTMRRERRTTIIGSARGGESYGMLAEEMVEEHAAEIASMTGISPIVGRAATRQRLFEEMATADVIHIAAHGAHDQAAPWFDCLYLSEHEDRDGRVFAHDTLTADLRGVRLVTLAACESALGRVDINDNIRGMPAGFLLAGVEAVVACLWPVRPKPATYFFGELHRLLAHGSSTLDAFRKAQIATRHSYSKYRDWGAFSLIMGRHNDMEETSA